MRSIPEFEVKLEASTFTLVWPSFDEQDAFRIDGKASRIKKEDKVVCTIRIRKSSLVNAMLAVLQGTEACVGRRRSATEKRGTIVPGGRTAEHRPPGGGPKGVASRASNVRRPGLSLPLAERVDREGGVDRTVT